jgi:MSHA biogenesis protein MshQ
MPVVIERRRIFVTSEPSQSIGGSYGRGGGYTWEVPPDVRILRFRLLGGGGGGGALGVTPDGSNRLRGGNAGGGGAFIMATIAAPLLGPRILLNAGLSGPFDTTGFGGLAGGDSTVAVVTPNGNLTILQARGGAGGEDEAGSGGAGGAVPDATDLASTPYGAGPYITMSGDAGTSGSYAALITGQAFTSRPGRGGSGASGYNITAGTFFDSSLSYISGLGWFPRRNAGSGGATPSNGGGGGNVNVPGYPQDIIGYPGAGANGPTGAGEIGTNYGGYGCGGGGGGPYGGYGGSGYVEVTW